MEIHLLVTHYYDETGHSQEIDSAYFSLESAQAERDNRNESHKRKKDYCQDYSVSTVFIIDQEAAEARAAQLQAERDTLEQRVRELDDEVERLRNATNNTIRVFERMASLDWRTDGETPLGQALDGLGDDVEP